MNKTVRVRGRCESKDATALPPLSESIQHLHNTTPPRMGIAHCEFVHASSFLSHFCGLYNKSYFFKKSLTYLNLRHLKTKMNPDWDWKCKLNVPNMCEGFGNEWLWWTLVVGLVQETLQMNCLKASHSLHQFSTARLHFPTILMTLDSFERSFNHLIIVNTWGFNSFQLYLKI